MPNYCLLVEYAGEGFAGWQIQAAGARTVQGCLADAVEQISGERVAVMGSGRTDAGVHAEAQVASFFLEREMEPGKLQRALNGVLPREIAVRAVREVDPAFDALRSARGKRYRYRIWNHPVRSPLRAARFAHVPQALDLIAMARAAESLVGEHDFRSFQAAGSGFLRYMVRNLVGTLLEVGLGRRSAASMAETLAARDRARAGPTAPALGLSLESVEYGESSGWGADDSPTSDGKTAASEDSEA